MAVILPQSTGTVYHFGIVTTIHTKKNKQTCVPVEVTVNDSSRELDVLASRVNVPMNVGMLVFWLVLEKGG